MLTNANQYPWFIILVMFFIAGCGSAEKPADATAKKMMTVYKSPSCGCCEKWVEQLKAAGFDIRIEHPDDLLAIKLQYGIERDLQSCHTAVIDGYFFEGHIPADDVKRFLTEKPTNAHMCSPYQLSSTTPACGCQKDTPLAIYILHLRCFVTLSGSLFIQSPRFTR